MGGEPGQAVRGGQAVGMFHGVDELFRKTIGRGGAASISPQRCNARVLEGLQAFRNQAGVVVEKHEWKQLRNSWHGPCYWLARGLIYEWKQFRNSWHAPCYWLARGLKLPARGLILFVS